MDGIKRPLISYEDITLPYGTNHLSSSPSRSSNPPAKKRKWNKPKIWRGNSSENPTNGNPKNTLPSSQLEAEQGTMEVGEESRDLTYDEIWDDSALIDAWNAATEEYEAYNGPDKGWKREPVHKSPLWYNIPPTSSNISAKPTEQTAIETTLVSFSTNDEEADSQPFNFDSFVPSHDPSLDLPHLPTVPDVGSASRQLPGPPEIIASQDEAFTRALGAMYWGGYWTAVYHYQRRVASQQGPTSNIELNGEEEGGEEGETESEDMEEERFVATQR